jgi:ATP-dependent helicase/nuclease subunit B
VQAQFLLGPAGSGKTVRCLTDAGQQLLQSPTGNPLVFIAPRQATYQIERRLLAGPEIAGYTRFYVLSFERLANFIFDLLRRPGPAIISEEGRIMVLRALMSKHRQQLKVFHASARLAGFSAQVSALLEEFQRNQLSVATLREIAAKIRDVEGLDSKVQDLAAILELYTKWLANHDLKDVDSLLDIAAAALREVPPTQDLFEQSSRICIDSLWVDGFAEFSNQELEVLAALAPFCRRMTLTLSLDREPAGKSSWLSSWSIVERTYSDCRKRFAAIPGAQLSTEILDRHAKSRFERSADLQHLEKYWNEPLQRGDRPLTPALSPSEGERENRLPIVEQGEASAVQSAKVRMRPSPAAAMSIESRNGVVLRDSRVLGVAAAEDGTSHSPVRIVSCKNPEAEAVFAAREVLRHVRAGGRYRDVGVLVRNLHDYHASLRRVFTRYGIPFFMDRREAVSHHPAIELTRSALRTVALGWQRDDFFAALKTGFAAEQDEGIDEFENEALARGWQGAMLKEPLREGSSPELKWLESLLKRIIPSFHRLELALAGNKITGRKLAQALRQFWNDLRVEDQLLEWSAGGVATRSSSLPPSMHSTVWDAMLSLLENMELAFHDEAPSLREWLSILEAAFANFSVGIIPPALDQVLVGTVDRSRDADIKLAFVLGLNETIFPALPDRGSLLGETERTELERHSTLSSASVRTQLARERFYAYIACTRPREKLILTFASENSEGSPLNRSPFVAHIQRLFPLIRIESGDSKEPEHVCELIAPLMKALATGREGTAAIASQGSDASAPGTAAAGDGRTPLLNAASGWETLARLPALSGIAREIHSLGVSGQSAISRELARVLYGQTLRTSVSRIEQYAACPFKFFVHSGLRAQERKQFELDTREQGNFQHEALALFHSELQKDGLRWRDLTPADARKRIADAATSLLLTYRDGLFQTTERSRFMGRMLAASLQDFVETLVEWMREQYQFDPVAVELPFGDQASAAVPAASSSSLPPYQIDLGSGRKLAFKGRIDRIDLSTAPGSDEVFCVVVDYKSSHKQLDPVLLAHGIQLQLLTYLNVLRRLPGAERVFGVRNLVPAGVFYVSLRGKYPRKETRADAIKPSTEDRKSAYQHTGRFDMRALCRLDARPGAAKGDQFSFWLKADGVPRKNSKEIMQSEDFIALLDSVEKSIREMGLRIFSGAAEVSPFRKGPLTACAHCEYRAICRVDPWTQEYRVLK